MALRIEGELYIVESQDGWYWPTHGIQRTKFSDWIILADNADFHVCHLPLNAEARAKFNKTAAVKAFEELEGLPYGYHTFLFGWIDTPENNWPPLMPPKFVPIVFSILSNIIPSTTDIFIEQALNVRLNTTGLKFGEIAGTAADRNLTIEDLLAQPEQDGVIYHGLLPRDGQSYVCSSFVAAMYKAAGLLGDIQGTEFTPRDVYTLAVFDTTSPRPQQCV